MSVGNLSIEKDHVISARILHASLVNMLYLLRCPSSAVSLFSFPRRSSRYCLSGSGHLDGLFDAVGLGRVDLLARLGNLGEDLLVGEVGDDLGALVLERDFVALDACGGGSS